MLIIGLVIKLLMKRIDVMRGFVSVATEGSFRRVGENTVNKIQTDWMSADEPALKKRQKFSAYLLPKNEFNVKARINLLINYALPRRTVGTSNI